MFVHPSGSTVSINFLVNNEKIAMGGPVLTASVSAAAFLGGILKSVTAYLERPKFTTGTLAIFFRL